MPKLQVVVAPNNGISYHRIINRISYLNMGEDWTCEILWWGEDEHKIDCDILWYSKYLRTGAKWLKKLKDKGTKIIVDVDDNWNLPSSHPRYQQWVSTGRPQAVIENIKIADVVTCSTMKIQKLVREYNKSTVVIPNAFPYGYNQYQPGNKEEREKMTFIYSGGSTHYPDVKLLEGTFRRIGTDNIRYKTEYLLAGYEPQKVIVTDNNGNPTEKQGRGEWDKMASVFKQTNSYRILPSISLDEYLEYYDMADVALIPLVQNEWNSYKSELKVLEAAVKRIPVICSKVEPYSNLYPCEGIMWVDDTTTWLEWIRYCTKNPKYVKDQGELLANWIWKEYSLITWNETTKQLLNSLIK